MAGCLAATAEPRKSYIIQEPGISKAGIHRSLVSLLTTFFVLSDANKEICFGIALIILSPTLHGTDFVL